jgi:hypothetical protein
MNRAIGFSTGALAPGDFRTALSLMRGWNLSVVELSALRDQELVPLLDALDSLDISPYTYVSVHAPSAFITLSERDAANHLASLLPRRWPIIVHPDTITDFSLWESFGEWLCIENMDKRKPVGRTVAELEIVFQRFPTATFCFDIGHARQIDPTMSEAALILRKFKGRLRQVHMSEVSSRSRHGGISLTALNSFRKVAHLIPLEVPVILEAIVPPDQIELQTILAEKALRPVTESSSTPHDSNGSYRPDSPAPAGRSTS